MQRYQVTFVPSGRTADVDEGCTILDAAQSIDISLDHVCGGACACATCHVLVMRGLEHLDPQSEEEKNMLLDASAWKPNSRLACQTEVLTNLVVEIPSVPCI